MRPLKDLLPTSFEVTVIPLALAYVFFVITYPAGLFPSLLAPFGYIGMCGSFIVLDAIDGLPLRTVLLKIAFVLLITLPMLVSLLLSVLGDGWP